MMRVARDTANAVSDDRERFEFAVAGTKAFIDYRCAGNVVRVTYACVPWDFRGRAADEGRLAPNDVLERATAVKRVTSQCASAVAVTLALGAVLAGGLLGPRACAEGAARARSEHVQTSNGLPPGRAKSTAAAQRSKLSPQQDSAAAKAIGGDRLVASATPHDTGLAAAHPAESSRVQVHAAAGTDEHGARSQRPKAAPKRHVALRLDDVFDPDFASGPQPLPYPPHGFIEQSFGTDGEESTAAAVALPISSHWAATVGFMHGTSDAFEYGLVPGGAGQPPRLAALPGSVNFTTLHAQVMYHPNSHFTAVFGVTSSRSNLTINPALKPDPVNY